MIIPYPTLQPNGPRRLRPRRLLPLALCALLVLPPVLAGCGQDSTSKKRAEGPDLDAIFGNGFEDDSPVIATVGDLEITESMLDMRYEEMPRQLRARFSGEGWEKRLLRFMVEEALIVQGALEKELYLIPEVAQHLISQRRSTLKTAMEDFHLAEDLEPTDQQIEQYFERNRDQYMRQGTLRARHVQLDTEEKARIAYDRIRSAQVPNREFAMVVGTMSTNKESAKQAGELGWFNEGGFIPALPYGKEFSERVWDWEIGLHEPVEIGGDWHVVEILQREYERPLTLKEARDRVIVELTPLIQEEVREAYLREAKKETPIEYFGVYRAGEGKSPRELLERAWYAKTPEQKIDIYKLLVEDFPESELADDALFLLANVYLDTWDDRAFTARYLRRLVQNYPESELVPDAQFMLENMGRPEFLEPASPEDLKKLSKPD